MSFFNICSDDWEKNDIACIVLAIENEEGINHSKEAVAVQGIVICCRSANYIRNKPNISHIASIVPFFQAHHNGLIPSMQCRWRVDCLGQRPGVKDYTVFKESGWFHYLIKYVDSAPPLNTDTSLRIRIVTLFRLLMWVPWTFSKKKYVGKSLTWW